MNSIKLIMINSFIENNKEQLLIQYEQDGEFKECLLTHKFDTVEPWYSDIQTDELKELLVQFADRVEKKR